MNLSPIWAEYLLAAGFDAVHCASVGLDDATDDEVMRWASREKRIVMTNDLDFGAIPAASGESGPSVVQLRSALLRPSDIGERVIMALSRTRAELVTGALLSIDTTRSRVRLLPLR